MSTASKAGPFDLLEDAALPRLAEALDPVGMARRFAEGFAERARGPAPHVHACDVEEVYYRAGRHCGILYRLRLNGHDTPAREEWLYARLLPRPLLRERFEKALDQVVAAGASALVSTALEPVSLWDELGMVVWTFPNDPKLPGLRAMADPARVRRQWARARAGRGLPAASAAPGFERVKYMPTKRCVLRYVVAEGLTFFAKAYPTGESAAPYRLQRAVLERLVATHARVEVAEPIAHLPAESAIWFADWGGRGLIDEAAEHGWDAMAERAATALAAFHRVAMPGLPARAAPAEALAEARTDLDRYAGRVTGHGGLARELLARLERAQPDGNGERPRVALHGAFRAEHVLVRGAHTAFLDLDGVAAGDPLVDAAEFVASLEFLGLRTGGLDAERVSRRFLECYAAAVPWPVQGDRLGWYALVSIVRKLHGAVKRLARPTLDRLEAHGPELAERWLGLADLAPRAPRPRPGSATHRAHVKAGAR